MALLFVTLPAVAASCSFVLDDPIEPTPGDTGGAAGAGGAGGEGGVACIDDRGLQSGCADGWRDGYSGPTIEDDPPDIAACAGRFDVPGATAARSGNPDCVAIGDDRCQPDIAGCSALDLCATGWHICDSADEMLARFPDFGCMQDPEPGTFWMSAVGQDGAGGCGGGTGNVLGCGDHGEGDFDECKPPFDARMDLTACTASPPWACTGSDGNDELLRISKPGLGGGGVLCCRD
jgi:hypothetical protein